MASVLVVDDAADYCTEIATGLSRDGHTVHVATSPRQAIDLACVFRPDVLVTDWMLRSHIDGLSVSEVVRVISPSTQTVLITGFASEDLRVDCERQHIFDFIEKPFHLNQIRQTVRAAANQRKHLSSFASKIGVLLTDDSNHVLFSNNTILEMVHALGRNGEIHTLEDLIPPYEILRVREESASGWVEVTPIAPQTVTWHVRTRSLNEANADLWVIVPDSQVICRQSSLVYRLLGYSEPSLQLQGHVLVVDDDESIRQMTSGVLRELNCVCHAAASHEEAIRLFVRDTDIHYAILDFEMPDGNPAELAKTLQKLRPDVCLIGTSGSGHVEDFRKIGISRYLPKPWNLESLIDVLTET